jgi:predicted N-formylglutamate amidohydrolase
LTRPQFDALLITCEHATNAVPEQLLGAFLDNPDVLDTHRAWDPGAVVLARELAERFAAPIIEGSFTRLLMDLNRRADARGVFSEFTPRQAEDGLRAIHEEWRKRVLYAADEAITGGKLLHLSIHSFTPELDGQVRDAEIGLLFDPKSKLEKAAAAELKRALTASLPDARIRNNYPYLGTSDGMTTWLRTRMEPGRYAGLEIELNQSFAAGEPETWQPTRAAIIEAVASMVTVY